MTIRTILAAASGGSASEGAIELACRWAARFGAHLEGFHVRSDGRAALAMAGSDIVIPDVFEQLSLQAAEHAARTKAAFDAIVKRHNLPLLVAPPPERTAGSSSACWREETGYAPSLVARRARFFDVVVLGRSERVAGEPYTQTIEDTLAQAGRPILLAPAEPPEGLGSRIALAWNGSREAVRAVAAALPLLAAAELVSVIMIGDADDAASLAALQEYFAWHGVTSQTSVLSSPVQSAGEALLEAATAAGADLLVMGGYGRRPWREALFGGATRDVLTLNTLPLLLVH